MFLLMTACALEGTDESGRESYQDEREDEETEPMARTCAEALVDMGYDPWYPAEDDWDSRHPFTLDDIDWDVTDRKWLVVRWEADNERGFNVSCDDLGYSPYVEASGLSQYWACSLEAGIDPYTDPDCAEGLPEYASTGGDGYLDEEGDGTYVPEE